MLNFTDRRYLTVAGLLYWRGISKSFRGVSLRSPCSELDSVRAMEELSQEVLHMQVRLQLFIFIYSMLVCLFTCCFCLPRTLGIASQCFNCEPHSQLSTLLSKKPNRPAPALSTVLVTPPPPPIADDFSHFLNKYLVKTPAVSIGVLL